LFSFVLVNIALYELETIDSFFGKSEQLKYQRLGYGFRYGAHLLYFCQDNYIAVLDQLKRVFYMVGIDMTVLNITIVKAQDGFDFLGWRFIIKPNCSVIHYPNKSNWLSYKTKIKLTLRSPKYSIQSRIKTLQYITTKWYLYHRSCQMYKMKSQLYKLKLWCIRYLRAASNMSKQSRLLCIRPIFINPLDFSYIGKK
jgi:RNA-directed DNA polymerase